MKLTYIEIEANAEEMKSTNSITENFLGVFNRCFEKARFRYSTEEAEENEAEE